MDKGFEAICLAAHNKTPPEDVCAGVWDYMAYEAMAALYSRAALGEITRDQGAEEREEIERKYLDFRKVYVTAMNTYAGCLELFKTLRPLMASYRADKTIDCADRIVEAIGGVIGKEKIK